MLSLCAMSSEFIFLDCESVNTTYVSISKIFSVSINEIMKFLESIDLEDYYKKYDPTQTSDVVLLPLFEEEFRKSPNPLDHIYWFHLTRTWAGNDFSDGILPLNLALKKIWPLLFNIFSGTKHLNRLKKLKNKGVNDHHFQSKTNHEYLSGPYGLLIYDKTFKGSVVKIGYLDIPEIIEDICNGYQTLYNESIQDTVIESLVPCRIKFKSRKYVDQSVVGIALKYLYNIYHNIELSIQCNTCFDGEGKSIPRKDIVNIEYLRQKNS